MEGKNQQNSILKSNLFKIPIEKYEKDMESELSRGKKKEILDLFTNYNKLHSEFDFKEIEVKLHFACEKGDLELIKIYLCKKIKIDSYELKIDETNQTASLFKISNINKDELIIPRSVTHESKDYLITSIVGADRKIKTLKFVEDSAVETIYSNAFFFLRIEKIDFPASLKELKEGWCSNTQKLKKISISPLNGQFKIKDDKYLFGKTDPNNDEFDILLFACRDIEEISIPSNIKIISSFALEYCQNLKKVEIPQNSNLQTIGTNAFVLSEIEEIYFPASLRELKKDWCSNMQKLKKISISPSNGQFIIKDDKYLFGKTDPNSDEFDILLFVNRDIEEISIPSNIKIISSSAFDNSDNLRKVEIPPNSNLQIIEANAFLESNIESIFIPSKVSKICEFAFCFCQNLTKLEIAPNSNLQTIESNAFLESKIISFFIPSEVSKIYDDAFSFCNYFQIIEFSAESKLDSFPLNAFSNCSNLIIMIPSSNKQLIH